MTDTEFRELIDQLQQGNEAPLDRLFLDHYKFCIEQLQKQFNSGKYYCSEDDAKDLFMDGLLKLRTELLKGKVENRNLRAYLMTICRNIWMKRKQKEKGAVPLDLDKVEYYLGQKEGLFNDDFNPLVKAELAEELKLTEKKQIDSFNQAWQKLGEKCKNLLKAFYIDRLKLKDLQERFGYSSYDSIKSMRRKCFNNLLKWKNEYFR